MKFDLTLGLVDRPGQLLKALEPIAKNGGNIISIIHERERTTGGYVPVSLVVDFSSKRNFEKTKLELTDIDISVIKSGEVVEKIGITFILIGRLDVRKILEIEAEGARIVDFEVSAPTSKEACIKLNVETTLKSAERFSTKLKELTEERNAVFISSM